MSTDPISSAASALQSLVTFLPTNEKLTRANYPSWKAQVVSALKGTRLLGFIDPAAAPPATHLPPKEGAEDKTHYETWVAKDGQVLNYLQSNMSKEILGVINSETTAAKAWAAIEGLFASQSRARIISTRMALATATKGNSTVSEYLTKMKGLADEMASAGRKLEYDELVSYILTGLDLEFNPVVSAIAARVEPITVGDLFTQLTSFEQRLEIKGGSNGGSFQSSANMAAKGGRGGGQNNNNNRGGRGGFGRSGQGRGQPRGGRGGGRPQGNGGGFQAGIFCQLCGKEGHTVIRCFRRFDTNYTGPPQKSASSAQTSSYGIDSNWYMDTGATDHITSDLEKLSFREKYHGGDQVHAANGSGMEIVHVGQSTLRTPDSNLHLNRILHIPATHKNLLFVHRLTNDNNVFVEFHPNHYAIKQEQTKRTLLTGRCKGGLYPLRSSTNNSSPNKQALGAVKPSCSLWHHRLGHASTSVVKQILSRHSFPFVFDSNKGHVCNACQQGKTHQLPYPRSTSVSDRPLDLIFSDVWGPAPTSVGRHSYYVSFIDDHSKFVWIYLLRHKSEVFQCFHNFQKLVERQFSRKILAVQTDWGGEYRSLNSFFQRIGISHHVYCPHAHQQNGSAERKHRHIVEVGLSLLSHASMPLKFWDEAFLTAVHLINRLPPKVIDNDSPYHLLLAQDPDYSSLRVFRCACWPNLWPYNTRKLQFRSKRCVFLGYSNIHKGYKCLILPKGESISPEMLSLMKKFFLFHLCILMPVLDLSRRFYYSLIIFVILILLGMLHH